MKAKISNFWWQHAYSLGAWWIVLGIITVAFGTYVVYDEGVRMIWEVVLGIVILVAGVKTIQSSKKRKAGETT